MIISDLSRCRPASSVSREPEQRKWQLIPYEAEGVSGTMIGAASFIDAPDVTIPLRAFGWHAVYVAYWNPYYAYDGGTVVKFKLSDAPCFRRFREGGGCRSQTETSLREVLLDHAYLTGRDLVIGKANGPLGQKAYVAYIKLVPMSLAEVAAVEGERVRTDTRRLVATIDGLSYFHHAECTRAEHVRELVEPYRHSDVGKVLWAVNYGDRTNYPSKVGSFVGSDASRSHLVQGNGTNPYIIGEKAMWEGLRGFAASGALPQEIAAEHAHRMGLKFDIMFRLGISRHLPPQRHDSAQSFVARHPQCRQVLRDGTPIEKASYAFPEVRQFMLSLIREATEMFDVDGINLCFVRGPHFTSYERPLIDDFWRKYGEDACKVDPGDPRLIKTRARYLTEFVRNTRQVLDEVGRRKARRLTLSIWAWPSKRNVWCGRRPIDEGLDIEAWIREGLLDSIICQEGIDEDYIALGRHHGCKFVLFTGYRGDKAMSPETIAESHRAGVSDFAYWDIDCVQDLPQVWTWLRRVGHREEMEAWDERAPAIRYVPIRSIAGLDASKGLQQAVYSGG